MEQAYAQALWRMIDGGMQPKRVAQALVELLKARGREALLPRIVRAFTRLAEQKMRNNSVALSVARESDAHAAKRYAKAFLEQSGADAKDVQVKIDESLIGGWRLEGKGLLVDESFKKKLLDMYNAAIA